MWRKAQAPDGCEQDNHPFAGSETIGCQAEINPTRDRKARTPEDIDYARVFQDQADDPENDHQPEDDQTPGAVDC